MQSSHVQYQSTSIKRPSRGLNWENKETNFVACVAGGIVWVCNVSCFDDTVNITIFQKVIASRVYIFSSCERVLLEELFFLFVILKAFSGPPKASALDENVCV